MGKANINPEIFVLNDIRGLYPAQLNEEAAYVIGRALVIFLRKHERAGRPITISVGRDIRPSSKTLYKALTKGITDQGGNVYDIGLATTPMSYFAVIHHEFSGGVTITASHNPNPFNGFKMVRRGAAPIGETGGLKELKQIALHIERFPLEDKKGGVRKKDIIHEYMRHTLRDARGKKYPLRVVVDGGNGLAGIVAPAILKRVGVTVIPLYLKLDGNFPNHIPDPIIEANRRDLIRMVKEKNADMGIAFDGDADRMILIDSTGETIFGDKVTALVAQDLLGENPGVKILYNIISSNVVAETIRKAGGKPVRSRVGHAIIKAKMKRDKIFFGGEFSGHYFWSKNGYIESPFFVLLRIFEIMRRTQKSFHELMRPFRKYFHSGEINFNVRDRYGKVKIIEKRFTGKGGRISHLDGLRIDFPDWWFSLRPSGTEPLVRLVVEATSKKILETRKKQLINAIGKKYLIDIEAYKKKQTGKV